MYQKESFNMGKYFNFNRRNVNVQHRLYATAHSKSVILLKKIFFYYLIGEITPTNLHI